MNRDGTDQLGAVAVVVTYRRPRLATQVVRGLIEKEGFDPQQVILVINGEGGLDDAGLQRSLDVVQLDQNLGPAGGFAAGARRFLDHFQSPWVYLCEDDVGLFNLPTPRVADLIVRAEQWLARHPNERPPAIVAYGRDLNPRTGITTIHQPSDPNGLHGVDVAPWGASLVARDILEAGVLPDDEWFFGYEDFDFWLRTRAAGFPILLDGTAAQSATSAAFGEGRDAAFRGARPDDATEPWRDYYVARNFMELARRHGHLGWTLWHFAKSARRWQLGSPPARKAIVAGLRDGIRRRTGRNDDHVRTVGELGG